MIVLSINVNRRHVWVSGIVQGVFYRISTRDAALDLGLAGWVRNLPDGRVEAVFEGAREDVERMTDWCRSGPPSAVVESVETVSEEPEGLRGFSIR